MTRKIPGRQDAKIGVYEAYMDHQAALKRFIARFLPSSHDIEDVSQETFLRAFSTEQGRRIEQPRSFLFRIAKHIALTQLTRKSRQITDYLREIDNSDALYTEFSAEEETMAKESLGIHCDAVASLPPQCRRVYLMRKVYGMSHKQIAESLDIAVSTVEKHLIKGVEQCDSYVYSKMQEVLPDEDHISSVKRSGAKR
ncbi:MAG: RNA polymerase sigma factor [Gammaproteobacteria bacterium]